MDSIANGNKLPFPDNSFDHATMVSVFQYIKHRKKATQELMRVLKPGAEIYIINCRGGLSECIQNSYHSSDIQKLFEKE
jgi:ubiquinone/menaquinone biosynthesis C-methylase UbiE